MTVCEIIDWSENFRSISLIKLIREESELSLSEAKALVEKLIDGEPIQIHVPDEAKDNFRKKAEEFGAIFASV